MTLPAFIYDSVNTEGGSFSANWPDPKTLSDLEKNKDFVFIDHDRNGVHLDDITLPDDYIVTGVKFSLTGNSGLELEVQGTRFDYASGSLTTDDSKWIKSDNMENPPERYNQNRYLL